MRAPPLTGQLRGFERFAMYFDFANVLVFLALGLVLAGMMLGLGRLVRPSNPLAPKLTTYECGEPPTGSAWINFNIRFYLVALIFVIFDVEVGFMYPVVTVYRDWLLSGRGAVALTEILLFIGILAVGLVYVMVKRDLEWVKQLPRDTPEAIGKDLPRAA